MKMCLIPVYIFFARFPIAIKTSQNVDPEESDSILDEAKSMFQVGKYHNHIVNLQGITFGVIKAGERLSEVGFLYLHTKL